MTNQDLTRPERAEPGARTVAVRTGRDGANDYGAVPPSIHLTSTFTFESFGIPRARAVAGLLEEHPSVVKPSKTRTGSTEVL